VTPFNCLHMVSYYRPGPSCSNFVSKMHRFRDGDILDENHLKPTTLSFGTFLGGDPSEFSTSRTLSKSEIMELSGGVHITILLSLC